MARYQSPFITPITQPLAVSSTGRAGAGRVRMSAPATFNEWTPSGASAEDRLPWFHTLGMFDNDNELRNAVLLRHDDNGAHWDQRVARAGANLDETDTAAWSFGVASVDWQTAAGYDFYDITFDSDCFANDDYIVLATVQELGPRLAGVERSPVSGADIRIHTTEAAGSKAGTKDAHVGFVAYGPPPAYTDAGAGWDSPPTDWVIHEVLRSTDLNNLLDNDAALQALLQVEHDSSGTHAPAPGVPKAIANVNWDGGTTYSLNEDMSYGVASVTGVAGPPDMVTVTFDDWFNAADEYLGIVTCSGRTGRVFGAVRHNSNTFCQVYMYDGASSTPVHADFTITLYGDH